MCLFFHLLSGHRIHSRNVLRTVSGAMLTLLLALCVHGAAPLDQEQDLQQKEEEPSVVKVSDGLYKIGSIILDRNKSEVSVTGEVNMQQGMIEYLACAQQGKLHESVLVLDVRPYELQVALLLLGLEPRGNLEYQGDPQTPQGDSVDVWVEWQEKEETKRYRGEDLVFNIPRNKTMKHTPWVFTGSKIVDGTFMAEVERSLIATFHDPYTIIDNPLPTGVDDTLYRVNEDLVPTKGTPVTVILKPSRSVTEN